MKKSLRALALIMAIVLLASFFGGFVNANFRPDEILNAELQTFFYEMSEPIDTWRFARWMYWIVYWFFFGWIWLP